MKYKKYLLRNACLWFGKIICKIAFLRVSLVGRRGAHVNMNKKIIGNDTKYVKLTYSGLYRLSVQLKFSDNNIYNRIPMEIKSQYM